MREANAPYLWFLELKEALLELGFLQSPLDACLFTLPTADRQTCHGALGIHVDDGLCGGDETFDAAIATLEKKYPFGAKQAKDFVFTGIHVQQQTNGEIHLDPLM